MWRAQVTARQLYRGSPLTEPLRGLVKGWASLAKKLTARCARLMHTHTHTHPHTLRFALPQEYTKRSKSYFVIRFLERPSVPAAR